MLVLDLPSDHKGVVSICYDASVQVKKKKRTKTVVSCAYMLIYISSGTKY